MSKILITGANGLVGHALRRICPKFSHLCSEPPCNRCTQTCPQCIPGTKESPGDVRSSAPEATGYLSPLCRLGIPRFHHCPVPPLAVPSLGLVGQNPHLGRIVDLRDPGWSRTPHPSSRDHDDSFLSTARLWSVPAVSQRPRSLSVDPVGCISGRSLFFRISVFLPVSLRDRTSCSAL